MRKSEAWTIETTFWVIVCLALGLSQLLLSSSCAPVKAVEAGVRVDAENCREVSTPASKADRTLLDCVSGGEFRVRIELARSAWEAATRDTGTPLPPAYADAGVTLAVDGAHCKANAADERRNETALLDCHAGSASYVVTIGREEWRAIEAKTIPAPYPTGPGK